MSSKRGKLAEKRALVGQSRTPIHVDTSHLERVDREALDGDAEDVVAFWVPIADVRPSPFQYRYDVNEDKLESLMRSIEARELYQPITVRPLATGKYEVVLGHRRLEAFRRLGRSRVPAIVREYDDAQAVRALLDENLRRADVNAFEQTEGVVRLLAIELGLAGEPVSAVRRFLEDMRAVKRSGAELREERHLHAERLITDVTGAGWESFLLNRMSLYRLPAELQLEVRGGMPYSLAVAIGRLAAAQHGEALAFVRLGDGAWRTREELRAWTREHAPARPAPFDAERLKRLARRGAAATLSERDAARAAELLDELERLLA